MIHDKLTLLCAVADHPPGTVFRITPARKVEGTLNYWTRCAEHIVDGSNRGMGMDALLEAGITVTADNDTAPCPWCHYRAGGA